MGKFERGSGILLHPTSLPSKYGIGELGGEIFKFIDLLNKMNQKYWQILPIGPTGYGDSPYQSISSFAGNPLLISIDELIKDGLISETDLGTIKFNDKIVEFGKIIPYKEKILKIAFDNFKKENFDTTKFNKFVKIHSDWLDDYSVFSSLKQDFELKAWYQWPTEYHESDSNEVEYYKELNSEKIEYFKFIQYLFNKDWNNVRKYAKEKNIKIIGDIPIFVAYDSVDTWSNRELFKMNEDSSLKYVSGVPPDHFSETGQLWGNPVYDWDVCKQSEYQFWINRVKRTLEMVDIIRIDHFRGFQAFWEILADASTAIEGKWVDGPSSDLFEHLRKALGNLPLIAEDLGVITPDVTALRDKYLMPGMKVLQYGFSRSKDPSNEHLPHNYEKNFVVYSGTHDNDTSLGWWLSSGKKVKEHFIEYTNSDQTDIISDMINLGSASAADICIFPLQDLLRKNSSCRMNFPGKAFGNWQWRFHFIEMKEKWVKEFKEMTVVNDRS